MAWAGSANTVATRAGGVRRAVLLTAACLTTFTVMACPSDTKARAIHNLASSPDGLRTPEAREVFAEQMSGAPSPDDLGSALPRGIDAAAIARLIVPPRDASPVGMVGLKPWPAQPGWFIAFACTGGNGPTNSRVDGCSGGGSTSRLRAYIALVKKDAGRLQLVTGPVAVEADVDWNGSLLPSSPEAVEDPDPGNTRALQPSAYDRLDLAPYHIAPGQTAFGVRASWFDGYAGGFGWHSAILLYAVVKGRLRQVLAVPTVALTFLAGERKRDGTRDHEIEEGANVIIVSEHQSAGHADLVIRSRTTGQQRSFSWDAISMRYVEA